MLACFTYLWNEYVESLFIYYTSNSPSVDLKFYRSYTNEMLYSSTRHLHLHSLIPRSIYSAHLSLLLYSPLWVRAGSSNVCSCWICWKLSYEYGICLYRCSVLFCSFFCSSFLPLLMSFWILLCTSCMVAVATKASAACALICMFTVSDSQADKA